MSESVFRIAVPKGRLMKSTLKALVASGLLSDREIEVGRKLVVSLDELSETLGVPVRLLLLKNADVPTYVEHGVAQVGVCGTDVLDEADADVYEPLTFPFGRCRISIAARNEIRPEELRARETLRIATKYPRIARRWFARQGWNVDVIKLNGSVELGAVLGLSDAIVDLVETGRTLKENHLRVIEDIGETRVKLIANKSLSRRDARAAQSLVEALRGESATGDEA